MSVIGRRMKEWEVPKEKDNFLLGKGRYKFWALSIIILLAFWSMVSGSASLKWSTGNLMLFSDEIDKRLQDDFDGLEIEAREKVVHHMWDVYIQNPHLKLSIFWQEAFQATYEELEIKSLRARDHAILEIAKMSLTLVEMDPVTQKMSLTFLRRCCSFIWKELCKENSGQPSQNRTTCARVIDACYNSKSLSNFQRMENLKSQIIESEDGFYIGICKDFKENGGHILLGSKM